MPRRGLLWRILAAPIFLGAAVFCLFLVAGVAAAGKPPPAPPPEGGVIYYHQIGDTCWKMNTDGSQKTLVLSNMPFAAEPSEHLHGGMRWFLTVLPIEGESYPKGAARKELFAVSESGGRVQLSQDATLEPVMIITRVTTSLVTTSLAKVQPRWTLDDWRVSYLARRWGTDPDTGAPDIVDVGLYAIDLSADVAQLPPAVAPYRVPVDFSGQQCTDNDGYPEPCGYWMDWSPDGSAIVYILSGEVFLADPETGAAVLVPLTPATYPQFQCVRWSPDGTRIMLADGPDIILTCSLDGSASQAVVTSDRKTYPGLGLWSPSGASIIFDRRPLFKSWPGWQEYPSAIWDSDTFRASASGGGQVNLTGDVAEPAFPLGWRAAE